MMSFDTLSDLNWLAVIVAAVAWWILGAIWYAPPLFGRAWQRSMGLESIEGGPGVSTYVIPLIAYFIATVALGMIAASTGSSTFGDGIVLGLVVGVGFGLTLYWVEATFGQRPQPTTWFLITGLYQLIGILIASVIVTVWD
jgi:Na+/H+ antiporter NhaA